MKGIAAAKIRADIRKQQTGSARVKLKNRMHKEEIITATEPNVSARMWRKTPYMFSSWWL